MLPRLFCYFFVTIQPVFLLNFKNTSDIFVTFEVYNSLANKEKTLFHAAVFVISCGLCGKPKIRLEKFQNA